MSHNSRSSSSSSGGASFVSLLTVLFIGLKLANVIDWSWWWILSPMWISGLLAIIVLIVMIVVSTTKGWL